MEEDNPIHLAVERGDLAEVQRLITEDPALMELRDGINCTPLILAARNGRGEMVEWLLDQGADPEAQDNEGRDALCHASFRGHTAVVSFLLDRGFDVNRRRTNGGYVPLIAAADSGHVAVVELLLSREEIEIDRQNDGGWTALSWASLWGHPQVIGLLLQAGADSRIARNGGRTPLAEARAEGHEECSQLLEVSK